MLCYSQPSCQPRSRNRRSQLNRPRKAAMAPFCGLVVGFGCIQIHVHDFSLHARSKLGLLSANPCLPELGQQPPRCCRSRGWQSDCMMARAMHAVFLLILFGEPLSSRLTYVNFFLFFDRCQDQVLDFDTAWSSFAQCIRPRMVGFSYSPPWQGGLSLLRW